MCFWYFNIQCTKIMVWFWEPKVKSNNQDRIRPFWNSTNRIVYESRKSQMARTKFVTLRVEWSHYFIDFDSWQCGVLNILNLFFSFISIEIISIENIYFLNYLYHANIAILNRVWWTFDFYHKSVIVVYTHFLFMAGMFKLAIVVAEVLNWNRH